MNKKEKPATEGPRAVLDRYNAALQLIPAPGAGCHPALLGVANLGALANLDPEQIHNDIRRSIPQRGRRVPNNEIFKTIQKALRDHQGGTFTPRPRPKPVIRDGRAALQKIISQSKISCDATDCAEFEKQGNKLMGIMAELQPQDGFEGMLICQMVVVHEQAMNCIRMASLNKSFAEMHFNLKNQGIKLMRLYAQQLEALDKYRRKGNQKMTVEHVHVHEGGQAIVGNVNQEGG